MYIPTQFKADDLAETHAAMRAVRLAQLVTTGPSGLIATPLPMMLDAAEGEYGTLYAHVAKANPQWRAPNQEALVTFMGPDAYISPAHYVSKQRDGKVVPTWNYVAVHAYGPVEFFEDAARLLEIVTRLTQQHEQGRADPWAVSDAPRAVHRRPAQGDRRRPHSHHPGWRASAS